MTENCAFAITTCTMVFGPQLWENACVVTESHAITSVLANSSSTFMDHGTSFPSELFEPPG